LNDEIDEQQLSFCNPYRFHSERNESNQSHQRKIYNVQQNASPVNGQYQSINGAIASVASTIAMMSLHDQSQQNEVWSASGAIWPTHGLGLSGHY
jgi:hypothetical protein